jgi:hypothetical protein
MIPPLLAGSFCVVFACSIVVAQSAGLRGEAQERLHIARLGPPDPMTTERVIAIEAAVAVRVPPTRLRTVFSVSATGENAAAASALGRARLQQARNTLGTAWVAGDDIDIDIDFIAAVPVYAWEIARPGDTEALIERRSGVRMQQPARRGRR